MYQVSHVKKTIITVVSTTVKRGNAPTRMAMPNKISRDAHKHGQFQAPWRKEFKVHRTRLKVLFELVHEAKGII